MQNIYSDETPIKIDFDPVVKKGEISDFVAFVTFFFIITCTWIVGIILFVEAL